MEEILPGVFHWKAVHPRIGIEVGCHFVAGSGTAIDPLMPAEGIEWFDRFGVQRVVLSNRHHLRHAERLVERFGCPILCHESGLHELEEGQRVKGFAFGGQLADDITALEMGAICPDDTVLRLDVDGGALLFADSLINHGGVGFVSDELIGDDPADVKIRIRRRCAALLDQRFEHLLFAHGDPLLGRGREVLLGMATGGAA